MSIDLKKAKQELHVVWAQAKIAGPNSELSKGLFNILREIERLENIEQKKTIDEEKWVQDIRDLCKTEESIAAVKLYRSKTGVGLREAMFAVENIIAAMQK